MRQTKPGKTLLLIMVIDIIMIVAIVTFCIYQWKEDAVSFFEHKASPLTILLSACLGVLSAVFAAMSNRRETVRQNTLDLLNRLDSDNDYWMEADKLTCAINHYREKRVQSDKCKHTSISECKCQLPSLSEIDKEFEDFINSNPNSKLAEKVNSQQTNAYVRTNLVIRKMEWLCERAESGLINYHMLAKRKGTMINFTYDACEQIIHKKKEAHSLKYGTYGTNTSSLVYNHICQKKIREKLYKTAIKISNDIESSSIA
ncbi:DUF4760 domain-containing protein [Vibrio parahaemolyticus]